MKRCLLPFLPSVYAITIGVLLAEAGPQSAPQRPGIALKNPGFEGTVDDSSGKRVPSHWSLRGGLRRNPGNANLPLEWPPSAIDGVVVSRDCARSGEYGLLMRKDPNDPRTIAQTSTQLSKDKESHPWRYVVRAFVRTDSVNVTRARIDVYGRRYGPAAVGYELFLSQEWQPIFVYLDGRKLRTEEAWIRLVGWVFSGKVMWDDVSIEKVKLPPKQSPDEEAWQAGMSRMAQPSPTAPGEIVVERPTFHALGFEWPIQGDLNRNGKVTVEFRKVGSQAWKDALPMHRSLFEETNLGYRQMDNVCPNMYAGSVMGLEPETKYEVKFRLTDSDGGDAERTIRTRTKRVPRAFEGGRRLHVYPAGHEGEKETPAFAGLQAAYDRAQAGDIILVHAGVHTVPKERWQVSHFGRLVYGEHDKRHVLYDFKKAGTFERPILIRGAGDGEAVLDGSGADYLFDLATANHHHLENLTLRNCDRAILTWERGTEDWEREGTTGLVVRRCKISATGHILYFTSWTDVHDFTICDNIIAGRLAEVWQTRGKWINERGGYKSAYKPIALGIRGQGHDICYNRVDGVFDGINAGASSTDVYGNHITHCMDDGLELDGGRYNQRVHHNLIDGALMAISAQPVHGGPAYIHHNVTYNVKLEPVKLHNYPSGLWVINNTFFSDTGFFKMPPIWSNSRFLNNLFILPDKVTRGLPPDRWSKRGTIYTGTLTPGTSLMDHNGYRDNGKRLGWVLAKCGRVERRPFQEFDDFAAFSKATGMERHGVWGRNFGDFVKAKDCGETGTPFEENDLRPRTGSKAIDAGVAVGQLTAGFTGAALDLGAHEVGRPLPHYGPRPR